ncbi:MAG: sulfatase [Alphaproteobacteria bacterium]|nr:sulfatase [Alphaproteobacteria bacterium]MCB9688292.1 sulfatase [Alphaproteobacteria bacterium]MCB9697502.1 sulfatase [Alphaproteobacteria bacterium]
MWWWIACTTTTTLPTPGTPTGETGTPQRPPDIVYVTIDTTRRDHLAPWGDPALTPNVARLAEGALRYDQAQAGASWTKPSMATTLASQDAWEHGVWDWPDAIDPNTPTLFSVLHGAGWRLEAVVGHNALAAYAAPYAASFDVYDTSSWEGIGYPGDLVTSETLVDQALGYLDALEADPGAPFLLWVHLFDPHDTYFDHDDVVDLGTTKADRYAEEVAYTDQQLGRLLDRVLDRPDTLIVLHADHGEELGDHGRYGHAFSLYQELLGVPLLIRGPGVEPGVVTAPVGLIDLAPTMLALVGQTPPDSFRGTSLLPSPAARPLFAETRRFADLRSVRDGDLQLVWNVATASGRLFDLATDPAQKLDASERLPDDRLRMQTLLSEVYPEVSAY